MMYTWVVIAYPPDSSSPQVFCVLSVRNRPAAAGVGEGFNGLDVHEAARFADARPPVCFGAGGARLVYRLSRVC